MKILVVGKDGQVGRELQRALAPLGRLHAFGRADLDISREAEVTRVVETLVPDVIVNAAAYTAVDRAETDQRSAEAINALAPRHLARLASGCGALLVHYSTDYVFDGRKAGAYRETDAPQPLSVYGRTKLAGEQAVLSSGADHLIFRTSWVYSMHGSNFAKTMLRLASQRDHLRVVADQVGAPTSAELIADVTALAVYRVMQPKVDRRAISGLFHLAAQGATSWHGYAQTLLRLAAGSGMTLAAGPEKVEAISTTQYPTPAPRPANSRLDCSKLEHTFGLELPVWEAHLQRLIDQMSRGDGNAT